MSSQRRQLSDLRHVFIPALWNLFHFAESRISVAISFRCAVTNPDLYQNMTDAASILSAIRPSFGVLQ
ncbi:hypothetical protein B7L58_20060 [Escherichia coli]|nr:hypothetical protein B7L58_20060 [Escherichia coli]